MSEPTPDQIRAAHLRTLAAAHDFQAATLRMAAEMVTASAALQGFMSSLQEGCDRELAGHPDLAELNVMMDGYYGGPNL